MNLFFNLDESKYTSGTAKQATMLCAAIFFTTLFLKAHAAGADVLQFAQYIK